MPAAASQLRNLFIMVPKASSYERSCGAEPCERLLAPPKNPDGAL